MQRPYLAALAALVFCTSSFAKEFSPEELARRSIERCAVEAAIWGMPAVNYERMLQAASDNGAKLNQVVYWSRPVNWKNQTLTPNPDTIYLNPFYDTTNGPVVVEIPPADTGARLLAAGGDHQRQVDTACRREDGTMKAVATIAFAAAKPYVCIDLGWRS